MRPIMIVVPLVHILRNAAEVRRFLEALDAARETGQ